MFYGSRLALAADIRRSLGRDDIPLWWNAAPTSCGRAHWLGAIDAPATLRRMQGLPQVAATLARPMKKAESPSPSRRSLRSLLRARTSC